MSFAMQLKTSRY